MSKILPLRFWDDPVLSTVCDKIEDSEFGPQLEEFGRELLATMLDKNGIGLAAPQVGVLRRMFVMRFPDHEQMGPLVVCNPALALSGPPLQEREGCLSLPGIYEQVTRAGLVTMQYREPSGRTAAELVLPLWDARVAQHEFDHLNGIMFFDYKDKRSEYGARMSKQMSRQTMRNWEKERNKRGL